MDPDQFFALIFILGMFGGVFIVYLGIRQRSQQLEMRHRERMAMIERGQIPLESPLPRTTAVGLPAAGVGFRSMSLGIVVIAVGLGLMSIISIAAESPEVGVGIGGAIVIVGVAFLAVGFLKRSQHSQGGMTSSHHPMDRDPDL